MPTQSTSGSTRSALRRLWAAGLFAALVALIGLLAAAPRADGQACVDLTGRYLWTATAPDGSPIDRVLELRTDGTAVLTTTRPTTTAPVVTQTGRWSVVNNQVQVNLTVRNGQRYTDRFIFDRRGDQLVAINYDRTRYGSQGITFAKVGEVAEGVITGTVTYRERVALTPTTILTVRLVDLSRPNEPEALVAEQRIVNPGQVPVRFQLQYSPLAIDPLHRYAIGAIIEDQGAELLRTTDVYEVITQGRPSAGLGLLLRRV